MYPRPAQNFPSSCLNLLALELQASAIMTSSSNLSKQQISQNQYIFYKLGIQAKIQKMQALHNSNYYHLLQSKCSIICSLSSSKMNEGTRESSSPSTLCWLTAIPNSRSRWSNVLFWPLRAPGTCAGDWGWRKTLPPHYRLQRLGWLLYAERYSALGC